MATTFYFYDTETSGINARSQRVMQFAGQRTDMDLKVIGKPHNVLIKLTEEVIPEPEAIAVHGILPQQTLSDGLTEAEFVKLFQREVLDSDTIIVGFNNIRFDDEFVRHIMWRNLYDPYEWHWKEGRSRWDLLDVSRIIRALRPAGVKWPVDTKGKPTNRLVALSNENDLYHEDAHDALADVNATIELARLLKTAQPKMFNWLLKNKDKRSLSEYVNLKDPKPFIYSSGRYPSEYEKTTLAFPIAPGKEPDSLLVYDLRINPSDFIDLDIDELKKRVGFTAERDENINSLPVKKLALNRCPAIAPVEVLDSETEERIGLTESKAEEHAKILADNTSFGEMVRTIWEERAWPDQPKDVDFQLYGSDKPFIDDADKPKLSKLHEKEPDNLVGQQPQFVDERLDKMLIKFKARNYPDTMDLKEETAWQTYKKKRLNTGLPGQPTFEKFFERVENVRSSLGDKKTEMLIKYVEGLKTEDPKLL